MSIALSELPGGLRVVTDTMPSVETVTLGVWVNVGTRNETPEVNGVSHLLEHMAFKGTKRRSALQIVSEIEDVGGHLNAYTSRESTVYYATVLKENLPLAVDIISDILQHSIFEEAELERERGVVLQEIGQAADTPDDVVFDWFQEAAFPDQPIGRPILGTAEIVGRMPRQALVDYIGAEYGGARMIVAAAGNLDHDDFVRLSKAAFGEVKDISSDAAAPARYTGGDRREARDLEQAHLVLGFEGAAFGDEDYYPLAVLSTALGGGMSSRLFQEVREKRGLVYSIYTFTSAYRDSGIFGIYAGTGGNELKELVGVVCDELGKVAAQPLEDDELSRARMQIKAGVLMSLESTSSRAERLARQLQVYGRTIPVSEIADRIDAVTAEDTRRIAERLLASPPTVAALGPVAQLDDYSAIEAQLN